MFVPFFVLHSHEMHIYQYFSHIAASAANINSNYLEEQIGNCIIRSIFVPTSKEAVGECGSNEEGFSPFCGVIRPMLGRTGPLIAADREAAAQHFAKPRTTAATCVF